MELTTKVRKVSFDGEPSHWEGELIVNGETVCECTAPTFWGAIDTLNDYLSDPDGVVDKTELSFDANNR